MLMTLNIILTANADTGRGSRMRVRIKTLRMRSGYYFVHPRRGLNVVCVRCVCWARVWMPACETEKLRDSIRLESFNKTIYFSVPVFSLQTVIYIHSYNTIVALVTTPYKITAREIKAELRGF
jgi:hypothetical protein